MGFWDFFRFGKKKNKPATESGQNADRSGITDIVSTMGNQVAGQVMNTSKSENVKEVADASKSPEMARDSLKDIYTQLCNSKRGGLGLHNSNYYDNVISCLKAINNAMNVGFTNKPVTNHQMLSEMDDKYCDLISACEAYTARTPRTAKGIARKDIVTELQAKASSDRVALSAVRTDFCSLPPEEQSQKNWNQLLDQSRIIKLTVDDLFHMNKEETGQASEVITFTPEMEGLKGADGKPLKLSENHYFKLEENFDRGYSYYAPQIMESSFKRFPNLKDKDKELISKWARGYQFSSSDKELDSKIETRFKELSPEGITAIHYINSRLSSVGTTNDVLNRMGMPFGEDDDDIFNLSRRNVATSRMASLLGIDRLVAKSDTVEITDNTTNRTFRGNLMKQAKGDRTGKEAVNNIMAGKERKYLRDLPSGCPDIELNTSGNFQRDLCILQVFDTICGQVDRHNGNFLVSQEKENGEITGLQAIDNDGAFGLNKDLFYVQETHARSAYDTKTGEMALPFLDKQFAERVKALDPEIIKYALKDLLSEQEIKNTIGRLNKVKKAIDTMDDKRLLSDDDWNDDTAQALIDQAWKMRQEHNAKNHSLLKENYFGKMMLTTLPMYNHEIGSPDVNAPQLLRRKQKMQSQQS